MSASKGHRFSKFMTKVATLTGVNCRNTMTSSNWNIFRVTGPLCGEFHSHGEFPSQRPVARSFDVFLDLRPNIQLSKQSCCWWFETPSRSLWRHCNATDVVILLLDKSSSRFQQQYVMLHLTYWDRNKMSASLQTTFSFPLSWIKMNEFRLTFNGSLFLSAKLTIFQHWFR